MLPNRELRAAARGQLKGTWLAAVGFVFVYCILMSVASAFLGIGLLIAGGPLTVGALGYFSRKVRGERAEFENLFDGFKNFASSFLLFLLYCLFVWLWSLLLVIPGIIKSFSYSMSFFILRDNPGMKAMEALDASKKMMKGHKWQLFCLYLSFIGWGILCLFTLGIGFLWLAPYMTQSFANFYESLKNSQDEVEAVIIN
jgi:uncharacterized membrane protein